MGARGERPAAAHIGCSGWSYGSWRGRLYPPQAPARLWLELYAQRFQTVEVNATFYRLPTRDAVAHWAAQTPARFTFAVKASRYLTHVKRLGDIATGMRRFFEPLAPLIESHKLGPVLWQLPENFHCDLERLDGTLAELPAGRHAFEFRHPSWFTEEVYELLERHGAALVLGDHPERPFQSDRATAPWRYVRFHFGSRGRRGNYSEAELESWAKRLHAMRAGSELFVYFNNDWEGFAPRNARWLEQRLRELAGEREPTGAHSSSSAARSVPL